MDKFCSEEEFLSVVVDGNKEVFDEILSRVFIKGVETALLYMPEAVDKISKRLAHTTKVFGKFIEDHPEFKEHRDLVLSTVQKVEFQNPTKGIEEVLELATKEIKKQIELSKKLGEKLCGV